MGDRIDHIIANSIPTTSIEENSGEAIQTRRTTAL